MDRKNRTIILTVALFGLILFFSTMPMSYAGVQFTQIKTSLNFAGNDVDRNGVLWAGDKNFGLWKSIDNGTSFQFVYRLPGVFDASNAYSGLVWNVFVDSRNYIFASAGGTNGLYRSTDGGTSFNRVLNTNGSRIESFYITMTEDNLGNLYTITYTGGLAQPQILKSTNGGTSWTKIGAGISNVLHFHNIKFNPYNGYLYLITGEIPPYTSYSDGEKIFRSKDNGATWTLVVDRNNALGTVYLAMAFAGSYVYIGQDYPSRICQIHRFQDDGSNRLFTPQIVYTPPGGEAMPFISGIQFSGAIVFANCAEVQSGITRVVSSVDGITWNVVISSSIGVSDDRWNHFTINPRSDAIFGTLKPGFVYQIKNNPSTTPTPTPTPTTTVSPSTSPSPSASPSPSPSPTASPTAAPTASPTASPMSSAAVTASATPIVTPSCTPPEEGGKIVSGKDRWALVNLLFVIAGVVLAVLATLRVF
ncbi:MAG: hypothetical protein LBQ98_10295, partial [Nitrososphaerota archaeon]|nr:hypothetical protein [Nitrososphaerota archaeon]